MSVQRGFSLIEVLVTIVILAFGLLGLAGLQARSMTMEMESYQRAQALVLLNDMVARLEANVAVGATPYASTSPFGTGDSQPDDCTSLAAGVARDQCEWSKQLKGAAETAGGANVGAMIGARGCIEEIQAPNPVTGTCAPGIYEVAVAWQGLVDTAAPSNACGEGLYGSTTLRRVVTARVTAATTGCTLL
ncbi:MAG: type IV pilus modification protein PilV [Rhodocyclaceae bacterium]|nr:type IV pilus modification protein PilV [Rhodocyclaceae bacterium]